MTTLPISQDKPSGPENPLPTSENGPERATLDAQTDNAAPDLPRPDRPIVLVGMMGAGKTTVGRRLANRLGLAFIDADAEIERAAGLSIPDIFELYGEKGFRDGERRVIQRLLDGRPKVLATGGGAYMNAETRNLISKNAIAIWLRANLDVLVARTARRNTRPLLNTGNPRQILGKLLKEREPVYAQAHIHIMTGKGPHGEVVESILSALSKYLKV